METYTLRYYAMQSMLANYPEIAAQLQQDIESALDQIENRVAEVLSAIPDRDHRGYIYNFISEELNNNWFDSEYFLNNSPIEFTDPIEFTESLHRTIKMLDLHMGTTTRIDQSQNGNIHILNITGSTVSPLKVQLQNFLEAHQAQMVGNFYIFPSIIIGYTVTDDTNMTITIQQ